MSREMRRMKEEYDGFVEENKRMRSALVDITARESILTSSRLSPMLGMEGPLPQRKPMERPQRAALPLESGAVLSDKQVGNAGLPPPSEDGGNPTRKRRLETSPPPEGGESPNLRKEKTEREEERRTEVAHTGKDTKSKATTPKASPRIVSNVMVAAPKAATKRQKKELARLERERMQALELANGFKKQIYGRKMRYTG